MGVPYDVCAEHLEKAVEQLFDSDPQIQAVGIGLHEREFGFRAIKNARRIVPASALKGAKKTPKTIAKAPVTITIANADIEPHAAVPHPLAASFVPERSQHRPIVCGLQIQNVDDDTRQRAAGKLGAGLIVIGTLGCFVRLANGNVAALSNNHVLAGENRGVKNTDRILQPGSLAFAAAEHIATLTDFVKLLPSPNTARPAMGNVVFNKVDAAVAQLESSIQFSQSYLPVRSMPAPQGTTKPRVNDKVFKIGRTTGLTHGTITAVGVVTGPISYDPGNCWFETQFEIEGDSGTLFSDHGDSGSAILSTTGEVLGLLYAGNGTQTYACPIDEILTALNCMLI